MILKDQPSRIHPTAVIHPGAALADDVEVGPYSVVGGHVTVGAGCRIGAHCILEGHTTIGEGNRFFTGAVIGSAPQDLKYKGEETRLTIGNQNTFREYVTVNLGTVGGGGETRVGSRILVMAYSHIAHDCQIGDEVVLANGATLGGHVTIEPRAILGGMVGIHQFVRVGRLAIIGGCSKAAQDVVPFATANGYPTRIYGVNKIGLDRAGIAAKTQQEIEKAFRILFRSGLSQTSALEKIEQEISKNQEISELVQFIRASKRGFCGGFRGGSKGSSQTTWNG